MLPKGHFDFERLDAFTVAVQVARWVRGVRWPAKTTHLQDQAMRAADSIVLNLAEGDASTGRNRAKHFAIARGSAGEVFAVTAIVDLEGADDARDKLRRLNQMLFRLR